MKKLTLFLCLLIFFSAAAAAAVLYGVSYFVDIDKYKADIIQSAEKEAGLKITCEKAELKKQFSPYLNIHLYHTGAMDFNNQKIFQAVNADLKIKTLPLLLKKIEIKEVHLERPIITIAEGYQFPALCFKGYSINTFIPVINLKNYKIKFRSENIDKTFYIEGKNLYGNIRNIKENSIKGGIKIQDLSFNIGNIISSNNNAELIFRGGSAEINAVFHLDEKDKAEISGSFGFAGKKFISLNTRAENISLGKLSKTAAAVYKIFNKKNPLKDIKAEGIVNADFNIKSDFKNLKSKGKAEIINASAVYKAFKYPISDINAEINFDNNEIKILKARSFVNKTPVQAEGKIKNNLDTFIKLYAHELDLKSAAGAFLKDGGFPVNIKKGRLDFKTEITGKIGELIKTKSDVLLKDLILEEKKTGAELKAASMSFYADDKKITLPETDIIFASSPAVISGAVQNYTSKKPEVQLNFKGKLAAASISDILKKYIPLPSKTLGALDISGSLEAAADRIKLKAEINADKDNYISYAVIKELLNKPSVLSIDIEADKNNTAVKDISLKDGKQPVLQITGRIEPAEIPVLKNVRLIVPAPVTLNTNFTGKEEVSFKADLTLNKTLKTPEIKGTAEILELNIPKYQTIIKNADIVFSPEIIKINAPETAAAGSGFNISADLKPDLKNITISNMQLVSMNLDLNPLFDIMKRENLFEKPYIEIQKGSAAINNFKIFNLKAQDISADFTLENNLLKITDINASAYSGRVSGRTDFSLQSGRLNINMRGKNLDINTSMRDLCGFNDKLSGKTDIKADISLNALARTAQTLTGNAEFNAHNGSMGTLGRFEYYMHAKNLLRRGILNSSLKRIVQNAPKENTMNYINADGRVSFKDGSIITEGLYTQGEKMSLFIKGRYNILTNLADMEINGRITEETVKKFNARENREDIFILPVSEEIIKEIPPLFGRTGRSDTFKAVTAGDFGAYDSIKYFVWTEPDKNSSEQKTEKEETPETKEQLPDFSDL